MWGTLSWCALPPDIDSLDALSSELLAMVDDDPSAVLIKAKEALKTARSMNYQTGVGRFHSRIAQATYRLGAYDSALVHFHHALQIRLDQADWYRASNTCIEINYVYQDLGLRDSSFKYLIEAAQLRSELNEPLLVAEVNIELAQLSIEYEEYQAADNYLREAVIITQHPTDSLLNYLLSSTRGIYHLATDAPDAALVHFNRAESYLPFFGTAVAARHQNYLAATHQALGSTEASLRAYRLASRQFRALDMQHDHCLLQYSLGQLYFDLGNPDSASHFLQNALDCSLELGDLINAKRAMVALSDWMINNGQFEQASALQRQLLQVSDSILTTEKVQHIARLQVQYKTELKEREIQLLNEQHKTQRAQRNALIAGLIVLLLVVVMLGLVYRQKKRLAARNEALAKEKIQSLLSQQESQVYNAMVEGQEEERKRIAADLHDRLGSMLSTVKLMFSDLNAKIDANQSQQDHKLEKITGVLDEAVAEVRKISHNLSTGMLVDFGLSKAVEAMCASMDATANLRCHFQQHGNNERIPTQVEVGVYRIIQEAVTNIIKHAKATSIHVQFNQTKEELMVCIEDNGRGFDIEQLPQNTGIGLKNMQQRATVMNGKLHIESSKGKGTMVIIEIPLHEPE